MMQIARSWRVLVAGLTVGVIGVVGFAVATASAEPVLPPRPNPTPPTVTQPVTIPPGALGNGTSGTAPSAASSPAAPAMPAAGPAPAATPVQPTLVPASSGTLRDYLQGKGVKLEAQRPQGFSALDVTLPVPTGWTQVPDPNVPDAFAVIADRSGASLYTSNAQVVVYKLIGDFDPKEAITHGYVDSQQLPAWRTTNASLADFGGFPSSIVEGTYRQNDMTLNTSRRYVIATSGSDRYLVSLAVTTAITQAVADAPATDATINGFRVSTPTPGPSGASAPAGPPGSPALPGSPPALPR